jgi:hypothetical protein
MNYKRPLGALALAAFLAVLWWFAIRNEHRNSSIPASPATSQQTSAGATKILELKSLPANPVAATAPAKNARALPSPEQRTKSTPTEPAFMAFEQWAERYEQADDAGKSALEAEGKLLAQARLTAFADLIQTNPERALQLAVTPEQRANFPQSIRTLLETPVNDAGDLAVLATLPFGSGTTTVPAVFRTATIDGEPHHVFTFGKGLNFLTRKSVPLSGYSVPTTASTKPIQNPLAKADKILVLDEHPLRPLAKSAIEEIKNGKGTAAKSVPADPVCAVSGQNWLATKTEAAGEIGGTILTFCGPAHLKLWEEQAIAAAGMVAPGGTKSLTTAESSYTEGRKRMLLMRP